MAKLRVTLVVDQEKLFRALVARSRPEVADDLGVRMLRILVNRGATMSDMFDLLRHGIDAVKVEQVDSASAAQDPTESSHGQTSEGRTPEDQV